MSLIKLIALPFAMLHLMLCGFFVAVTWLLDPTYDHEAAMRVAANQTEWINKLNNWSNQL